MFTCNMLTQLRETHCTKKQFFSEGNLYCSKIIPLTGTKLMHSKDTNQQRSSSFCLCQDEAVKFYSHRNFSWIFYAMRKEPKNKVFPSSLRLIKKTKTEIQLRNVKYFYILIHEFVPPPPTMRLNNVKFMEVCAVLG